MFLPILLAVCAAQKHRNRSMPEIYSFEKRVGLHSAVFRKVVMNVLDLPLAFPAKLLWSAKVRLAWLAVSYHRARLSQQRHPEPLVRSSTQPSSAGLVMSSLTTC